MELDLSFGEDAAISCNFKKLGMRWKKVQNYLANHYPKIEGYTIRRSGVVLRIEQVYVPKNVQIEEVRIAQRYDMISKRQGFDRLMKDRMRYMGSKPYQERVHVISTCSLFHENKMLNHT